MKHRQTILQVITLNVGGSRHTRSTPIDPARIAREVRGILPIDVNQPTLIALQEASRVWYQDAHPLDTAALLAAELGSDYRPYYAPEVDSELYPGRPIWKRPIYQGMRRVSDGNAIVTNLPLAPWPWTPRDAVDDPGIVITPISRATLYSTGDRDTQPRNLLALSVLSSIGPLVFMCTHLTTLVGEDRQDADHPRTQQASLERSFQAEQILHVLAEFRAAEIRASDGNPCPILLAGDFNACPDSREIRALTAAFTLLMPVANNPSGEKWTHLKHRVQIDHLLLSDPAQRLGQPSLCAICDPALVNDITDHLPIVAHFTLQPS